MVLDYRKLRGKIKEVFGTQSNLAEKMNVSRATLSDKLNQKSDFSHSEIILMCECLGISKNEISTYFFTLKV